MRTLSCIFFFFLISGAIPAQENKTSFLFKFISDKQLHGIKFTDEKIFDAAQNKNVSGNSIVTQFANLVPDKQALKKIIDNKPSGIRLSIPVGRQQAYTLLLAEEPINNAGDFSFGTITKDITLKTSTDQGLHYRGCIAGDTTSLACISFFKNGEVMGVFANEEGNFVIGKMKNAGTGYVVYKSSDMLIQPRYECAAKDTATGFSTLYKENDNVNKITTAPPVLCNKVRVYWEADYQLYSYNFSSDLSMVQDYLTGLFNIVSTLYQNEGIIIELSRTYVWTSADPYSNGTSNQGLNSFKARWNSLGDNYDGDLAHLIAGGTTNNGGVAYILNFDQCNRPYTYGYSNVYGNFQSYPSYSWDAQVVTHETGHNLGSHHTHWCGWNTGAGNACGAIDNCAALETGSGCGTCTSTTNINNLPPDFKGTIMSYCYLKNGIGVSFINGFGPLPQAAIRDNVIAASCLTSRNTWTGTINTAWENTGNWSCGSLPNSNTDVIIKTGIANYPVINSMATCRSIKEVAGSSIKVNSNFHLTITGKPVH